MALRQALLCLLLAVAAPMVAPATAQAATTTEVTQRYEIDATLDVASGRLDAIQTLTVTNEAAFDIDHVNLSVIPRALGYLTMDAAVTVDGAEVETSWTTSINLRVPLTERLGPDETATIRVPFQLNVGTSAGAFTARLSRENGVISFGQWFPILSREHEVHGIGDPQISYTAESIRLELTTTSALGRDAVACPGLVSAPEVSGTSWVCHADDVRDFSFAVNPNFRLTTRSVGETTIRVYTETVAGGVTADKAQAALIGLNQAYGAYPWPDLVVAEVGSAGGFSMEYPRAIHLTRSKVTDTYVIYHEVAHQWFYAQLGNDQLLEPWIDEAFADFSARYLMGVGVRHCSTRGVDSSVFAWEAGPISGGDWSSCDGYFHTVFNKGNEFLNVVRASMGDEEFFAALREFLDDNRYGFVTAQDLLEHLRAETDADLVPIYERYLTEYQEPISAHRLRSPARLGSFRPE